jgi:hypothetical protein
MGLGDEGKLDFTALGQRCSNTPYAGDRFPLSPAACLSRDAAVVTRM